MNDSIGREKGKNVDYDWKTILEIQTLDLSQQKWI